MVNATGLNTKAYTKGTSFPKYDNGKIRLYNMRFCPYAQRALLTLAAKNLEFEVVNINLADKPEWYLNDVNPLGKVPSVQTKDKIVYDSLICTEFIDELFPGNVQIMPKDIYERAQQKMLVERFSKLPSAIYPYLRNLNDETHINNVKEAIQLHEDLLVNDYFSGNKCGFVDYMTWPYLERLEGIKLLSEGKVDIYNGKYPKLAAYMQRMKARPEIQFAYRTPEQHFGFYKSVLSNAANYDLGRGYHCYLINNTIHRCLSQSITTKSASCKSKMLDIFDVVWLRIGDTTSKK